MKNKKLIFSVLFTGILFLNTFLFTNINENKLQLNSLFTLATAQTENVENGELWGYCLLEEYGIIRYAYLEGEYYYPALFGCIDALDKCWHYGD